MGHGYGPLLVGISQPHRPRKSAKRTRYQYKIHGIREEKICKKEEFDRDDGRMRAKAPR
jgi:CHAD domain-containing protein